MRLDFNILWVEDQQSAVLSQQTKLARLIRQEGFRLKVHFASSVDEARQLLKDSIYVDHVDLVLVDYNLGSAEDGAKGVVQIRGSMPFKEIVLYSSETRELRDVIFRERADGIYLSSREDLPETANGIFQTLVKKIIDIDHSRGIVMGATSDIDHFVNQSLVFLFDSCNEEEQRLALEIIGKRLESIKKRFGKSVMDMENIDHVSGILTKHSVYTSMDRLILLRKILSIRGTHMDMAEEIKQYEDKVVPKRNALGHIRADGHGLSRKFITASGEELTSEDMKKLRIALLKSHEMFENFMSSLSPE